VINKELKVLEHDHAAGLMQRIRETAERQRADRDPSPKLIHCLIKTTSRAYPEPYTRATEVYIQLGRLVWV
jgi:hypothetical protein